jgi:hypothetical protein
MVQRENLLLLDFTSLCKFPVLNGCHLCFLLKSSEEVFLILESHFICDLFN